VKNIFVDLANFTNCSSLAEAIYSFVKNNRNLMFFVKADGLEYPILDDFPSNIVRRNNFLESDMEKIDFYLKECESFYALDKNKENTYLRVLNNTQKAIRQIYLFCDEDNPNAFLNELEVCKSFYKTNIKDKTNPTLTYIKGYNDTSSLENLVTSDKGFSSFTELNKILSNENDIVIITKETSFYLFRMLETYSKFVKKEENVKSYLKLFAPFSYHKTQGKDINLETLFSNSTFEIKEDTINVFIKKDIQFSSILDFFKVLASFYSE